MIGIDISNDKFPEVGKGRPLYWIVKGEVVEKRIRYILKNLKDLNMVCLRNMLDRNLLDIAHYPYKWNKINELRRRCL